jgi:hypothetical protein
MGTVFLHRPFFFGFCFFKYARVCVFKKVKPTVFVGGILL